jgi:hypothetical protein
VLQILVPKAVEVQAKCIQVHAARNTPTRHQAQKPRSAADNPPPCNRSLPLPPLDQAVPAGARAPEAGPIQH